MRILAVLAFALPVGFAGPVVAQEKPDAEQIEKIMELLASMRCQMDEDDIEIDGDEIELDDVFCGGGQFDINLNDEMHVTGMRAE